MRDALSLLYFSPNSGITMCIKAEVGSIFRPTDEAGFFWTNWQYTLIFGRALAVQTPGGGNGASWTTFWNQQIGEILMVFNLGWTHLGDRSNTRAKQPYVDLLSHRVCFLQGEETPGTASEFEDLKTEIADKVDWVYDPAPYVFGMFL
ncbi:hypothetical protein BOTBODRAFT_180085 [Botryobasidium botryosum FD-172 SS1]|uniref:Uncharacterized protein n=1 Tax=Botryobasidium botryosum (strain FD-172 SS1) TaxID=930990 RepID=A0A067M8H7_BOTB1|nr:hypothetical protein BOTBODRAFT_180085 [Botryobasidium botryosum FD-172 SS1]